MKKQFLLIVALGAFANQMQGAAQWSQVPGGNAATLVPVYINYDGVADEFGQKITAQEHRYQGLPTDNDYVKSAQRHYNNYRDRLLAKIRNDRANGHVHNTYDSLMNQFFMKYVDWRGEALQAFIHYLLYLEELVKREQIVE